MSIDPSYDEISECARDLWQSRGQPEGQDNEIWLEAERQLRARTVTPSESTNATLRDAAPGSEKSPRKRGSGRNDSKVQADAN